jgi:hypothetical protein
MTTTPTDPIRGRCAVVYNPTKISDQFRDLVEKTLQREGWVDTMWLETSATDPGWAMTRQAVAAGVSLWCARAVTARSGSSRTDWPELGFRWD